MPIVFPEFVDWILIVLLTALLIYFAYLIFKRNRTIKVKGSDDFIYATFIMLILILINPVDVNMSMLAVVRSLLLYFALFFQFAIKRGLSDRGFEKIFFYIPWDKIEVVEVSEKPSMRGKILVTAQDKSRWRHNLYFSVAKSEEVLSYLNNFVSEHLMIRQDLAAKLEQYSQMRQDMNRPAVGIPKRKIKKKK